MREVRVLCYIIYCELLVAASSGVCSLQMIFSWLGVKGWLLLFSVGSWRFGQTFDRMLGFLKKPVVVTVEINMNLVALTVMGLISRLWGLSYPRAVVWVEWFIFHLNDRDFWFSKHLWIRTQEQKISACLMSVSVNTVILFPSETLLGGQGQSPCSSLYSEPFANRSMFPSLCPRSLQDHSSEVWHISASCVSVSMKFITANSFRSTWRGSSLWMTAALLLATCCSLWEVVSPELM